LNNSSKISKKRSSSARLKGYISKMPYYYLTLHLLFTLLNSKYVQPNKMLNNKTFKHTEKIYIYVYTCNNTLKKNEKAYTKIYLENVSKYLKIIKNAQ